MLRGQGGTEHLTPGTRRLRAPPRSLVSRSLLGPLCSGVPGDPWKLPSLLLTERCCSMESLKERIETVILKSQSKVGVAMMLSVEFRLRAHEKGVPFCKCCLNTVFPWSSHQREDSPSLLES